MLATLLATLDLRVLLDLVGLGAATVGAVTAASRGGSLVLRSFRFGVSTSTSTID